MNTPDPLALRISACLCLIVVLSLYFSGCKQQSPSTARTPTKRIVIFAPREMEPMIRAAEAVARTREKSWRIDLQIGGAQTLAWQIEAGDRPDLYIASTVNMAKTLIPKPTSITPWIQNHLVVITRADDPNPILRSERALERSTGPIAVGAVGTLLGDYTRLAIRYAEIGPLIERRTTQRSNPHLMIKSLRSGEVDHAILFASDAAGERGDLIIVQLLDLPAKTEMIYTQCPFSDLGAEFADLLMTPEAINQAKQAGYTPVTTDPSVRD